MKKYGHKTGGSGKTCRDGHNFILSSLAKYHARVCYRSLTRYFVGPVTFAIRALLSSPFN